MTSASRPSEPGFPIRFLCFCCLFITSAAFAQANNASVISHAFRPALINVGESTHFTITLQNQSTLPLSGQYIKYYQNTLDPVSITSSTCGSPVISASPYGELDLNSISLPAAPSASTPATCQIVLSVQGTHAGEYYFYFDDTSSSVALSSTLYPVVSYNVTPAVVVDAKFNPSTLSAPGTNQFEMTLFNSKKSAFQNGTYSYDFYPGLTLSSTPSSSTCPAGVTTNVSSNILTVSNLTLHAATSTSPYTCKIIFDVTTSAEDYYYAYFSTPDYDLIEGSPGPMFTVQAPQAGQANGSASLESSVILPGQTAFLTIRVDSPTAVSNRVLEYEFTPGLQQSGNPESTCPNMTFTHTAPTNSTLEQLRVEFTSTAGSCDITIPVTANQPGIYYIDTTYNTPYWSAYVSAPHRLLVLSGFSQTAIPSLSNPLLLLLALLLSGLAAMHFRVRAQ
ncbi:MAG: hypothetical protein LBP52_03015 [Burkholderiaceae bacterium]|nr:hypothetical protein [Burkholderiaceae bacterium]